MFEVPGIKLELPKQQVNALHADHAVDSVHALMMLNSCNSQVVEVVGY